MDSSIGARDDLTAARLRVQDGSASSAGLIEQAIAAAQAPDSRHAFLATSFAAAREAARATDRARAAGRELAPLAGLAVSIKDLFDVAGETTGAGSKLLASAPPASADAPAVARLRRSGAAFIGRTNMSEFAFSGVGINPHHGTPLNAATFRLDGVARIPGGSTSGGAVSVASGAAWASLGSDTGGSIRIPAALHGLVGFKGTARLVPTAGALPLSTTLDTVGAVTRSVRDAIVVHEILAQCAISREPRSLAAFRFAVPRTLVLDAVDGTVGIAFARSLSALSAAGARIDEVDLPELDRVASINAGGGFAPVESWAFHRRWLAGRESEYDPRVARRIRRGEAMTAADYIDLIAARRAWIADMELALQGIDALLSPTVPVVAPQLAPLIADDDAFFATNALLLRNPSMVNLLDGCALSVPCQRDGELPVGLMIWSTALQDSTVLAAGLAVEAALRSAFVVAPSG